MADEQSKLAFYDLKGGAIAGPTLILN